MRPVTNCIALIDIIFVIHYEVVRFTGNFQRIISEEHLLGIFDSPLFFWLGVGCASEITVY